MVRMDGWIDSLLVRMDGWMVRMDGWMVRMDGWIVYDNRRCII